MGGVRTCGGEEAVWVEEEDGTLNRVVWWGLWEILNRCTVILRGAKAAPSTNWEGEEGGVITRDGKRSGCEIHRRNVMWL